MNWIFADRLWCEYTRKITDKIKCEDSVLLGAPRVGFTRGRLGWLGHAEEFEALPWARQSALCYVQLLWPDSAAAHGWGAERVCGGFGNHPGPV